MENDNLIYLLVIKPIVVIGTIFLILSLVKPEEDDTFSSDPILISNRDEVESAVSNLKSPVFLNYEGGTATRNAYLHLSSAQYTYSFELDSDKMPRDLKTFLQDFHAIKVGVDVKEVAESLRAKTGVRLHGLLDLNYYISGNKLLSIEVKEYLSLEAIKNASINVGESTSFDATINPMSKVAKYLSFKSLKKVIPKVKEYYGAIRNAHYEVREYVHFWIIRSKKHFLLKLKLRIYNRCPRKELQNEIAAWGFDLFKISYKARIPLSDRKSVDKIFDHLSEFLDKSNDPVDNIVPDSDIHANGQSENPNSSRFGALWSWIKRKMFEGLISKLISLTLFIASPYICYLLELHKYPYLQYIFTVITGRRAIDDLET